MTVVELAEEHTAVIVKDRYPLSPRVGPLKSALAKLDPVKAPKRLPEAPARARVGHRTRR
jgi:hypothetical protein